MSAAPVETVCPEPCNPVHLHGPPVEALDLEDIMPRDRDEHSGRWRRSMPKRAVLLIAARIERNERVLGSGGEVDVWTTIVVSI